MTEFENKIYEVISSANGIKGAEIAKVLQVDKKEVNSALSKSTALKALVKQDNDYRWHLLAGKTRAGDAVAKPKPDERLHRLCNYYLQCISLEASGSVSQFLSSKYDQCYVVLSGLKIDPQKDTDALNLLKKINDNKDKKAYLGYPIRIYTIHSNKGSFQRIAPVFLFPVEYNGGTVEISWVPCVNMEVIKGYCGGKGDALANELVNLETELGMNNPESEIEVDELVLRLQQIRDWIWREDIDPYCIPDAQALSELSDGIYNRPVVIEAEKGKYTDGLESELMVLSMMPEENYRGTALHAWVRDQVEGSVQDSDAVQLLEVLPLNTEQAMAVKTALTSALTIVTGPPGTGKSQVVTDLLANIAWNGKSALFSSRNNKAVDVVDLRVNALSERPSLLRIGGSQYASRLAEIIEGLLNSSGTQHDLSDLQYMQQKYDELIQKERNLKQRKDELIGNRNSLDSLEQKYCDIRDIIGTCLFKIDEKDFGQVGKSAEACVSAYQRSKKENNGFFARLFWSSVEPKRLADLDAAVTNYNNHANHYGLRQANQQSGENLKEITDTAARFEKAMPLAVEYRKALSCMHETKTLEAIDQELLSIKRARADIAQKLWDKWLRTRRAEFTADERRNMSNFVASMKLTKDADLAAQPELRKQYSQMIQIMTRYLQCWAVTSLSAKSRIPFEPGVFDYVIIDEASQCDIASIIPLLFRAKRAVIIGDPKQLQHISQLTSKQDLAMIQKYGVDPMWSYSANSLYAIAAAKVKPENIIQLRDHFRSCAEIIEYSNETFYDGSLRTATAYNRLKVPAGEKPGIRWINVAGKTVRPNTGSAFNQEEINLVVSELRRLVQSGYTGSLGVTTPFHLQAEKIMQSLEKEPDLLSRLVNKHDFLADTVHKFQGDERDIMLFSSVVTNSAPAGTVGFLERTGNLFNVAVTRARSMLIVVGDYRYCAGCSIGYLRKFAAYYEKLAKGGISKTSGVYGNYTREYPTIPNSPTVSEWEKKLYTALYDAGIKTFPQYPADRYNLDLALILSDNRKLDIEVDGEMYHRNWNKELSYRDQLRNQRMFELGWDVKRFWVFQIRDDLEWCVSEIKKWCESCS